MHMIDKQVSQSHPAHNATYFASKFYSVLVYSLHEYLVQTNMPGAFSALGSDS